MYAINITPQNSQKCQYCQNTFIQYLGTQAWCTDCNKAIKTIQQETKVVPKMYQSNCKDKQSSAQIKIKNYLNEFCNKFGGLSDIEEFNFLYKQVLDLKNKKGICTKNYRQNSAVIAYLHFKDCHRLSIQQFCKRNQVNQKSFNKSYIMYQKMIKQRCHAKINEFNDSQYDLKKEEDLKIQFTQEQEYLKEQSEKFICLRKDYLNIDERLMYCRELSVPQKSNTKIQTDPSSKNQRFDRQNKHTTIQKVMFNNINLNRQIRAFLEVVFDSFFKSLLYIQKRSLLIEQLSQKILEIYQTLKNLFESSSFSFYISLQGSINDQNFYKYLFYLVLKKISHSISQVKYLKTIQNCTGQQIKTTILKSVTKALDVKQQTASFSGDSLFFVQNSGTTGSEFVKVQEKD